MRYKPTEKPKRTLSAIHIGNPRAKTGIAADFPLYGLSKFPGQPLDHETPNSSTDSFKKRFIKAACSGISQQRSA
jgi:hypothetical protein